MFSNWIVRPVVAGLFALGLCLSVKNGSHAQEVPQEPDEPAAVVSDQMKSVLQGGPRKLIQPPAPSLKDNESNQEPLDEQNPLEPIESNPADEAASDITPIEASKIDPKQEPTLATKPTKRDAKETKAVGAKDSEKTESSDTFDIDSIKQRVVQSQEVGSLIESIQIQPTSVDGIRIQVSTLDDLQKQWGEPRQTIDSEEGETTLVFDHALYQSIHATVIDSQVASLLLELKQPITPSAACQKLDLEESLGVDVFDEKGQLLGRAFPEHGALLSFQGGLRLPVVQHILIEPIDPEAFVARAQDDLHRTYLANLADLRFALENDPEYAQAHWLTARIHLATGQFDTALASAQRGSQIDPENALYQITLARCLAASGKHKQAVKTVEVLLKDQKLEPLVRAGALSLQGELVAGREGVNTSKAMRYHTRAIKLADSLAVSPDTQTRRLAKEILLDTHLAVARDIAWGNWKKKDEVVPRWLERASAFAEESIDNEGASLELRLRVAEKALMAYSRMTPAQDPSAWLQEAEETAERLLEDANDPLFVGRIEWRMGMANYHALSLARARGEAPQALTYAKAAMKYLDSGARLRESTIEDNHIVGRVFYQVGAIHAVLLKDHREAAKWYEQAVPRLNRGLRSSLLADMRGHGDALVSMGVTFWDTGDRKRAVQMTTAGSRILQRAVDERLISRDALSVAYGNLSVMHKRLGDTQQAQRYAERINSSSKRR